MKNLIPNLQWSFLLILTAFIAHTSCVPQDSDPVLLPDPGATLEIKTDAPIAYPLENLRMDPTTLKMLASLRSATAKYHRLEVAEEAGYSLGSECVASPAGGMGYHYVNFGLVDENYDPTAPEALLYEEDEDGNLKLVAVEFVIMKDPWDSENAEMPYFGSREFDVALAPIPLPFDNYQLHVWIWKNNPSGIFEKFNPNVECN